MRPHLLHVFPTFAPGGAQVRTVGLMRALAGELRHSVLPLDGRVDAAELVGDEVQLELLPAPPGAGTLGMVKQLRSLLAERRPDVVCTYNWGSIEAVMAARTRRTPVLHHEDGFLPDEARAFKRRRVWTRRLVLRSARAVIVPSHRLEEIALRIWKLPAPVVRWIPNGIHVPEPATEAERRAAREHFGLPHDAFVVGGVGHLRGEKRYDRLIDAFAGLERGENARLLVLGDGPERPGLEERAARADVRGRVLLPGHLADLTPAYRAMDVFAISSDTEQMPISLLEAMAVSLPAVSTDVGDVRRMLPESQGAFVVPRDGADGGGAPALAEAFGRLREETALRTRLGAANRVRATAEYAYDSMVTAYRDLYLGAAGQAAWKA